MRCIVSQRIDLGIHFLMILYSSGCTCEDAARERNMRLTQILIGAISPIQLLGNATHFFIDNNVFREAYIAISSGEPDSGIEMRTDTLAAILKAVRCDIVSVRYKTKSSST